MMSSTFETKQPLHWTSCLVIIGTIFCCNGLPHEKTTEMADSMQSASNSTAMPGATKLSEATAVDLADLLDAGDGAVVTLVSGDTRLAVHRAVLEAGSPALADMFCPGALEFCSREWNVPDVEGPVLRQLVALLYTGRAPQLPGMAPRLLAAVQKYGASHLPPAACSGQQVPKQLAVENAAATAVLAVRYSCHSLKQGAVAFIKNHLEVMATQGWAEAVHNHPGTVVEISRLIAGAPTETSAAATAEGTSAPTATPGPHRDQGQTPAAVPPPAADGNTQPPGAEQVSRLRSLSAEEKGRRLLEAAQDGSLEEVRALLAAGADVGAKDKDGWTALHQAAGRGHSAMVRALLEAAADPNAKDNSKWTPLHVAAVNDQPGAAAVLLEAGARRRLKDEQGQTALDVAKWENHQRLINLLQ